MGYPILIGSIAVSYGCCCGITLILSIDYWMITIGLCLAWKRGMRSKFFPRSSRIQYCLVDSTSALAVVSAVFQHLQPNCCTYIVQLSRKILRLPLTGIIAIL